MCRVKAGCRTSSRARPDNIGSPTDRQDNVDRRDYALEDHRQAKIIRLWRPPHNSDALIGRIMTVGTEHTHEHSQDGIACIGMHNADMNRK